MRKTLQKLINQQTIFFLGPQGTHMLDIYACNIQFGCFLFQKHRMGRDQPIRYFSRSHNDVGPSYGTVHKECLVAVLARLLLSLYLIGAQLRICTDFEAPPKMLNIADVSCKLFYWSPPLSELKFDVAHQVGIKHQSIDGISAQPDITELDNAWLILKIVPS